MMRIFDRNFRDIFLSQIVSIFGGLIAGTLLAIYTDKILLIPGMLILLPGFLEMRGNIGGTLASRISSGLFLGVIKKEGKSKIIIGNKRAAFFLTFIVSACLGLVAFLFNYIVLKAVTPQIILIPIIAGLITDFIEVPLTFVATFYLYKKGHDPNNIMGPFITTVGDISSVAGFLAAVVIL